MNREWHGITYIFKSSHLLLCRKADSMRVVGMSDDIGPGGGLVVWTRKAVVG